MPKVIKIYGPPGTGKTTTLISTLKSVLASGTPPIRVAYITHTKAACEEVKQRVADQLGLPLRDMKWFRTIHSMCCGMAGIGFYDTMGYRDVATFSRDTGYYISGAMGATMMEEVRPSLDDGYDVVLVADQLAKAQFKKIEDVISELPPSPKLVNPHDFLNVYQEWKTENGKKDFTDMLLEYYEGNYPAGDVDVVIVDEAQDLSALQWRIVQKFSATAKELHVAGDDDQSVYKFLGSDEFGFLDYPADEERVLTFSHRVPSDIGRFATKVIRKIDRRKDKEVEWQEFAGDIKRHQLDPDFLPWKKWAQGDCVDDSVMVLTRHRKQMYDLKKMLDKVNVPAMVNGSDIAIEPIAQSIKVYLEMKKMGARFRPTDVGKMLADMGLRDDAKRVRAIGAKNRASMIGLEDLSHLSIWTTDRWEPLFAKDRTAVQIQVEALRRRINQDGLEVIGVKPTINLSTYHGSKGREAKHIVLFTDCYGATWEEQERNPDTEIRLAYVGLTRAQKTVTIVAPQTNMWMRALV